MSVRKICLWGIPVLLVLAGAAYYIFFVDHHQVIKFSDDCKLTLLAVDYGKKHVPPPAKTTSGARARRGNTITTTNDTLVLWVQQEYPDREWHSFQYYIFDKSGQTCVQTYGSGSGRQGSEVVGVRVDAFPRRQGKFIVRVQENSNNGQEMSEGKFVISNPTKGSFPSWTPESVPVTKDDDDVSVTLTKITAGAKMPYNRGSDSDADDAINKGVQFSYHTERGGQPVTNWKPVSIVTTDATGNSINGWVNPNGGPGNAENLMLFQWGLWPDEPAWKIRMEFSQQSDFAPYEQWSLQNIPVAQGKQRDFYNFNPRTMKTNPPVADTILNGIHLSVYPATLFADVGPNSQPQGGFIVAADATDLNGMRLTLKITDDHADNIEFWDNGNWRNGGMTIYRYGLRDMMDATNLNVTIALHKSRFVEFTVKPDKASATTDQ